ncbi:hypothetical protein M2371_002862 [Buttiauxella sp. BIGb0471]|nr:hypothetical protein [Buttiauxella sp. BIGb0471]
MLNPLLKIAFFFIDGFITVSIGFSPILLIFSFFYFDKIKDTLNHAILAVVMFIISNIFYSISNKLKEKFKL